MAGRCALFIVVPPVVYARPAGCGVDQPTRRFQITCTSVVLPSGERTAPFKDRGYAATSSHPSVPMLFIVRSYSFIVLGSMTSVWYCHVPAAGVPGLYCCCVLATVYPSIVRGRQREEARPGPIH